MEGITFDLQRFSEVLVGKSGKDKLSVIGDKTQVYGLAGNDTLVSNGKKEVLLVGGSGNDVLSMTGGAGTLSGGKGKDTFYFNYSADQKISAVIEDIDPTNDKIVITYGSSATPKLKHSVSNGDVIWTDAKGYFNLTLKGSNAASDYYEGTAHNNIWDVFWIANREREKENLEPLTLSQGLMDGASIRAPEIIDKYEHERPDGTSCFTAVKKSYWSMGENIYSSPTSPEAAMIGWMNSPGHRANILKEGFKKIGVGYTYDGDSEWKHHWVQMFGSELYPLDTLSTDDILKTSMTAKKGTIPAASSSKLLSGTASADYLRNGVDGAKIKALGGKDSINNKGASVSISSGDDSDFVLNSGDKVTISSGTGVDSITNSGGINVKINGGASNDFINNDTRVDYSNYNEMTKKYEAIETVSPNKVTIDGGKGNDSIINYGGQKVSLAGGKGNDTIRNLNKDEYNFDTYKWEIVSKPDKVTLSGGAGNDFLENRGIKAKISGGTGNDTIKNYGSNVLFKYKTGDGNDIIEGFRADSTLSVSGGVYSSKESGSDIIVTVGKGKVTLVGAASLDKINIKCDKVLTLTDKSKSPITIASAVELANASARTKAIKITGNKLNNSLVGGADKDTLKGGKGNDSLVGGKGADKLYGQAGKDTLWGGAGNDSLWGGDGNDTFLYKPGEGKDTILDYKSGDMLKIVDGTFSKSKYSKGTLTLTVGSGSVIFKDVTTSTAFNINGTSYKISGSKLK